MNRFWHASEDAILRAMWPASSAREIGARLGKTRNSIIGRVNRLGLARPTKASLARAANKPARIRTPPMMGVKTFNLKPHHCRWPLWGKGRPTHEYCGVDSEPDSSYCAYHRRKSINMPERRAADRDKWKAAQAVR